MNGSPPQTGEHMLKVGTYNAIIASPNEFYSPEHLDLEKSHKTFKSMMPTFAWEVLEVYSGPPTVVFKWRHWGMMKGDYAGVNAYVLTYIFPTPLLSIHSLSPYLSLTPKSQPDRKSDQYRQNSKGENVTIPAHGGKIDIQGVTIARVSPEFRVQSLETFFDPLEMFRQIAPGGELSRVQGPSQGKDNESTGVTCPVVMNQE
jgi:hypothetical protein